ncbi:hypothetical protein HAX54_037087 [Datura stramonium]|uniref:Uncharacterized protein n=1 Tax=Datura stramonium TaxID=4076 RepID=A0ABS8SGM4_DATST|nr:hypothetical protein [Datura stramonium]
MFHLWCFLIVFFQTGADLSVYANSQVNGNNLSEIEGGEVATTNSLSCNGPEFVMQLRFHEKKSNGLNDGSGTEPSLEAHARLRCVYFPKLQGKESIEMILEKLEADGYKIEENFESFSQVSVRWLDRLLPDARWNDLEQHHPYTIAIRNFGNKQSDKENGTTYDVLVEIYKDGEKLTLLKLEKLYQDWMFQMHDRYDKEIDCGEDQPTFVFGPSHKKELGISSDVLRIHKVFQRKGITWKSGQKIKILKGAYRGFHKNNVFATLEFLILEGLQGNSGRTEPSLEAHARLRCVYFPKLQGKESIEMILEKLEADGYKIEENSSSQVVRWLDYCLLPVSRWLELNLSVIHSLQIKSFLASFMEPKRSKNDKGDVLKRCCFRVKCFIGEARIICRPLNVPAENGCRLTFDKESACFEIRDSKSLPISVIDSGKCLCVDNKEWEYRILKHHEKTTPSSIDILDAEQCQDLDIEGIESHILSEKEVHAKGSDKKSTHSVRVGSCFPEVLRVARFDRFSNRIPFKLTTEIEMKLISSSGRYIVSEFSYDQYITHDGYTMKFKNVAIESGELDMIRPNYEAALHICSKEDPFFLFSTVHSFSRTIATCPSPSIDFGKELIPGMIIKELALEFPFMFCHGDEVVSRKEFQTDRRSLQVASKKLVDDILRCRLCIRQCKANVERLNLKESNIKLEISNLRASMGLGFHDVGYDKDTSVSQFYTHQVRVPKRLHTLKTLYSTLLSELTRIVLYYSPTTVPVSLCSESLAAQRWTATNGKCRLTMTSYP